MYKIHYSNITLENMIGGNKPNIKSLKDLNLFPKGTLKSKLLNPTNGYEWSLNAFRNYYYFGDDNSPITKLTKKCYHELGEGVIDPTKFFLENKKILRNLIGQYLGFYFFYFTNKKDIDVLKNLGDGYFDSKFWGSDYKSTEDSIKNILRRIAKYNGETFNENQNIYKVDNKQLSDIIKAKIDKYLKLSPTVTVVSDSELSSPESSDSESSVSVEELYNKLYQKLNKNYFGKIFKMSSKNSNGTIYNIDELEGIELEGIFSIVLAILWEISDDKSGIKEYYEGLKEYIPVKIPDDFEDTTYTPNELENYVTDNNSDYNYILAYVSNKINGFLSIQEQQYPKFKVNEVQITFPDCGEISLKNFIKILCFDKKKNEFDITKLNELKPIQDLINFFKIFNTDDLHSSDKELEITFTRGTSNHTAKMNSRNAWAYLVSNREDVRYKKENKEISFKYEIPYGLVNYDSVEKETNMFALLKQLFKKDDLKWQDFDENIEIYLNSSGIGNILFDNNSYSWEFKKGHYQTIRNETEVSLKQDIWKIDESKKEKLNYLFSLVNVNKSFNKKLFYYYDWEYYEELIEYFNMLSYNKLNKLIKICNGYTINLDSQYTRLFRYIHENFNLDQKRRTILDLVKLDIDDYININHYDLGKYNKNFFNTNIESLIIKNDFDRPLEDTLDRFINLQSLTFGRDFDRPLGNSLSNLTNLKTLIFGNHFNKLLDDNLKNLTNLEKLILGDDFDEPLGNSLDNLINLKTLTFGKDFNKTLASSLVKLTNLQSLKFGKYFNQQIGTSLDKLVKLQTLIFGRYFNQPLDNSLDNLTSLQSLTFKYNSSSRISLDNLSNLKSLTLRSQNITPPLIFFNKFSNLQTLIFEKGLDMSLGKNLDNLSTLQSLTFGEDFNQSLDNSLDNLSTLKTLTFGKFFNKTLGISLDKLINLQSLTFGDRFNQPLGESLDKLTSLQSLTFGQDFDKKLDTSLDKLTNLQSLTFGYRFNQRLGNSLYKLTNLQSLTFGNHYNKYLDTSLNELKNLQSLKFGNDFNQSLNDCLDNITKLQSLTFGYDFNMPLDDNLNSLDKLTNLQELTFGHRFNQELNTSLSNLTNLQSLTFGIEFNQSLGYGLNNLISLKKLTFGFNFNQPLGTSLNELKDLNSLTFEGEFNKPLGKSLDKLTNLKSLTFGFHFEIPLGESLDKLTNLKSLTFGNFFNQSLGESLNELKNLQSLKFGNNFNQPLGESLDKLIKLESLTFGNNFNQPLDEILDNLPSLQLLILGASFNRFLKKNKNINVKFLEEESFRKNYFDSDNESSDEEDSDNESSDEEDSDNDY